MISQLMSIVLRCHRCVLTAASSSQEATNTDLATIRVFDNRDKNRAGELETIYSYSLYTSSVHRMCETLAEGGDVSNTFVRC